MNIQSLSVQFEVAPLQAQLASNPQAWDLYRWRTEHRQSPHREASDIWVRYNAIENFGPRFNEEHTAVWYPVAEDIPSVKPLVSKVMECVGGKQLGGVLITKLPAYRQIYPHVDRGWHAGFYEKFAIQVCGNDKQQFCFLDGSLSAKEGELYWFRNDVTHWVTNDSDEDRITLICCIRRAH